MIEYLHQILGSDLEKSAVIILNLILIESLLSVDNAAVLATMVMDLKPVERKKALRYGILGAYVFRGVCLIFAAWLVKIWWLKPLGGLYLLYLTYDYFSSKKTPEERDDTPYNDVSVQMPDNITDSFEVSGKEDKWVYKKTTGLFGKFWATVIAVEVMDLAFSMDNVFAAVAFTDNIVLICTGVFIGILAMRFVAQYFVRLLERYPFLEKSAFLVIGILGVKLLLSAVSHPFMDQQWAKVIESEGADLFVSILTACFFFVPIIFAKPLGLKAKEESKSTV